MEAEQARPLERFTITAPFGVRFWDVALRDFVRTGLRLRVTPSDNPTRELRAFPNHSGVWVVRGLRMRRTVQPGAREEDFEWGDGSQEFWDRWSTPAKALDITVGDAQGRFLPFRFTCHAPQRGFARCGCGILSPPAAPHEGPPDSMPMYSSPARVAPAGMASVRAQLIEPDCPSPPCDPRFASWTYLEVLIGGRVVGSSYADAQGRVNVTFPWPAPVEASLHSPPAGSGAASLLNQRWPVRLRARYDRLPAGEVPDLCRVLSQHQATLIDYVPGVPLGERYLEYGRELVVRSAEMGSPPSRSSELLIRP